MDDISKNIDAVSNLINSLVSQLGRAWTVFFMFATPIGAFLWQLFNTHRKDAIFNKLIAEKDTTISRMKDEIKLYRIDIFKQRGWSDEQIDKHVK